MNFFHIFYKTFTKLIYLKELLSVLYIKSIGNAKIHSRLTLFYSTSDSCAILTSKIHNLVREWAMQLGFGPKYFLKCVLTDSVNNSILKKIDFGLNGSDRVTNVNTNQYKFVTLDTGHSRIGSHLRQEPCLLSCWDLILCIEVQEL